MASVGMISIITLIVYYVFSNDVEALNLIYIYCIIYRTINIIVNIL